MNLKNIRKLQNLTQLELADKLGVDQTTVSKWENETSFPSIATLKKIADVLNCKIEDLI